MMGGLIFLFKRNWSLRGLHALMALSAGLLIAIANLDFIPDSLKHDSSSPVFVLIGLLAIYFFLHYVSCHFHFGEEIHVHQRVKSSAIGAMGGMLIHTFFDGLSIASSFTKDLHLGITVFIAVLLHKIPDGITISSIIFLLTRDRNKALLADLLLGVSTVAGAFTATLLSDLYLPSEQIAAAAIAFSAGIFIYVAATVLLPAVNSAGNRLTSSFFLRRYSIFLA